MPLPIRQFSLLLLIAAALPLASCSSTAMVWDTGQVKHQGPTDPSSGMRLGDWAFYNSDGTVRARGGYSMGQMDGKWTWYFYTGSPEYECEFVNGLRHGPCKKWQIDGVLRQTGNYASDKKSGPWIFYSKTGAPLVEIHFLEGKPHGECKIFHSDAGVKPPVKMICDFEYGAVAGSHRTYDRDGKLTTQATFVGGKMVDAKGWDVMSLKVGNDEAEEMVKKTMAEDAKVLKTIEEITNTDYRGEIKGR